MPATGCHLEITGPEAATDVVSDRNSVDMEVDDRDIDYELAVRDSIRTEGEDAARREAMEQNNKVNQELDEFLAAVEDVEDIDEPPSSGPNRKIPPPPSGKGKEPFIDISDGDDEW
jgi:hypothetical protein